MPTAALTDVMEPSPGAMDAWTRCQASPKLKTSCHYRPGPKASEWKGHNSNLSQARVLPTLHHALLFPGCFHVCHKNKKNYPAMVKRKNKLLLSDRGPTVPTALFKWYYRGEAKLIFSTLQTCSQLTARRRVLSCDRPHLSPRLVTNPPPYL